MDYTPAALIAQRIVGWLWGRPGLPSDLILNVNVPYGPIAEMKGVRVTRQGLRIYHDVLIRRLDPRGQPYYWIGGDAPTGVEEPGTDYGALSAGYVSVTPIQLDLTSSAVMDWLEDDDFDRTLS